MDINTLISSKIKKSGALYEVQFPNFYGLVEGVYYSHNSQKIDYCMNRFGARLDMSELSKDLEEVFLISKVFGNLWIRMIHAENPQADTLIIAESAKIVSFALRGTTYYGILSYDTEGHLALSTNFSGNEIFAHTFENGMWTISNRLTELTLFTFTFPYILEESLALSESIEKEYTSYEIYLVHDVLFPEKKEKQYIESYLKKSSIYRDNHILTGVYYKALNEDITQIQFSKSRDANKEHFEFELTKLIGIIGNHLVFTGSSIYVSGYLSLPDIEKSGISLSTHFTISDSITLIDPHWHEMRVALMELRYLVYSIENHILLTKKSLEMIDSLENPHLEAQEIRSEMTLENLEKMKHQYHKILQTLIATIQHTSLS